MAPRGVRFFVDHQADLVAQVQLVPRRHARDEADGVEAHDLHVDQVAAQEIGIVRELQADRDSGCTVWLAPQVDPPAVEPEVAVREAEIAEAAAVGLFVERARVRRLRRGPSRGTDTDRSVPRGAGCRSPSSASICDVARQESPAAGAGPPSRPLRAAATVNSTYPCTACEPRCCTYGLDVDLARSSARGGDDEQVIHVHRRDAEQFHRVDDAAVVEDGAGTERQDLAAVRRLVRTIPSIGSCRRIEHADGQPVLRAGLDGLGHVEHERRFAALVAADAASR